MSDETKRDDGHHKDDDATAKSGVLTILGAGIAHLTGPSGIIAAMQPTMQEARDHGQFSAAAAVIAAPNRSQVERSSSLHLM